MSKKRKRVFSLPLSGNNILHMNIKTAIKNYLEWGSIKFSIYTIRNYRHYLKEFSEWAENKAVDKVELTDILSFQKILTDKGLKKSTIFYYSITLRSFFGFLHDMGVNLKFRPTRIPLPRYVTRSWRPATKEMLTKLLKVNYEKDLWMAHRNELIVKFLFSSGVRVSELCDISLDSIDLGKGEAIIITKKNNVRRVIMWDDETNEVMNTYLDLRIDHAKCDYLFISRRGTKLSTRQVERIIKKLRERAGIHERIVPHSFRHGFGMRGVEANMNLRHLQVLLGHKHLLSSQVYMPYKDQNVRKAYNRTFNRKK